MKARFFALAALVLGLASCQQEFDGAATVGGEVDFQLKVDARELATRAGENGAADEQNAKDSAFGAIDYYQATNWDEVDLRYTLEVFDANVDYSGDVYPVKDRQVIIVDKYESVAFDLRLVPNREYRFVVFADFVENGEWEKEVNPAIEAQRELGLHHTIGDDLRDIKVKNDEDAINEECSDAYFASKVIKISNSAAQDIVLQRPYGKVRVIATDLDQLNINVDPGQVVVTYEAAHVAAFNAVTGAIDKEQRLQRVAYNFTYADDVTKMDLTNHYYNAGYDAAEENNLVENANGLVRQKYMTLFTDYILATDTQEPIHFTMTVKDKDGEDIKTTNFSTDIPVQRNYLTTIIGNVLTTATEINVTIDDNFANYHYFNLWDGKSIQEPAREGEIYIIYEAAELAWFADQVNNKGNKFSGKTLKLGKDIHLNHEFWTPIGATGKFEGTFDGDGFKIEGLFVSLKGKAAAGLFANAKYVRNLTVVNSQVYGNYKTGVIVGDGLCSRIDNCHVDGCEVVVTPYNQDEANNVGGIVGYLSAENEAWVKDCSVKNSKITAYRKVGGIVGAANQAAVVSGNKVENTTVIADMTAEYKETKPADAGAIVGYVHTKATVENNTIGNSVDVVVIIDTNGERDAYVAKDNERVHVTFVKGEYNFTQDLKVNGAIQANLGGKVTLNVNNQDITTGTNSDYGFIAKGEGNELVINNADIVSNGGGLSAVNNAKLVFNGNSVAVNTINTSARYNVYTANGGEVVINGGTFSFSKKDGKRAYVYAQPGSRVVINGGEFGKASTRSGYAGIMGEGEVIINAGTFGFDPTAWVSEESLIEKVGDVWVVTGARVIYSQAQLEAALTTEYREGQTLYLVNGDYVGHFDFSNKKLTIKSTNGAAYFKGMVWADNSDVKFESVHFTNPDGVQHPNPTNSQYYTTINNQYPLVGAYLNSDLEFENCTFHITGPTVYGFYGYANINPKFNNCKFECNGIRPIANNGDTLTITNSNFENAYHYAARIFENSGERMTITFKNNVMQGNNSKGEFEGINISKKGSTANVYADFAISGNTESLKYRYHKDVTLDASCTGAELFEKEQ